MRESIIQTCFGKYVNEHKEEFNNSVFELKLVKGNTLPFSKIQPHQIKALTDACGDGLFHKLTDPPIFSSSKNRFNVKRPFDCIFIKGVDAYLVVLFYKPRRKKTFILVEVKVLTDMMGSFVVNGRRSIREDELVLISNRTIVI
jgi:hypothetical protein